MTITYQVQPSTLAPEGVSEPYGRYQVILGESTTATATVTLETIVNTIQAGGSFLLKDSGGELIGQIVPTLTGGFTLSTSPTPGSTDIGLGFRPSKQLLAGVRFEPQFTRADTTFRQPAITTFTTWYQNEAYPSQYVVNGAHGSTVIIEGTNLKLDSTACLGTITLDQDSTPDVTGPTNVIAWTDKRIEYQTKMGMTPFSSSGSFTWASPLDRSVTFALTLVDMT
ncbi:MAG: hypothetical protein BWK79_00705 [Beggiatoa sp. IS2]|nr:MAG: hypothetical protein BWK79_00705 [Beggiatoa sp. IS2]